MKAKKAVKRLTRVEALLSKLVHQYAGNGHRVKRLLDSAKRCVVRAKVTVNDEAKDTKKPLTNVKKRLLRGLMSKREKKLSLAPQNE